MPRINGKGGGTGVHGQGATGGESAEPAQTPKLFIFAAEPRTPSFFRFKDIFPIDRERQIEYAFRQRYNLIHSRVFERGPRMLNRNFGIVIIVVGVLLTIAHFIWQGFREFDWMYMGPIALVLGLLIFFAAPKE